MSSSEQSSVAPFGAQVRDHLERVERVNADTLEVVAARLFTVVAGGGRVLTAGTGHSVGFILETFYRAGGLACVVPLYHPGLLPLHGAGESTLLEHTSGLARQIVGRVSPTADDLAFIASHSGINAVPVELAEELRSHGTAVVALMSVPHSSSAEARVGRKLGEVADHLLDTLVPYGDAVYPAGDGATAGLSSITNLHLWNLLLTRIADIAAARDLELPLWTSSNVAGGEQRNEVLLARYRTRAGAL